MARIQVKIFVFVSVALRNRTAGIAGFYVAWVSREREKHAGEIDEFGRKARRFRAEIPARVRAGRHGDFRHAHAVKFVSVDVDLRKAYAVFRTDARRFDRIDTTREKLRAEI